MKVIKGYYASGSIETEFYYELNKTLKNIIMKIWYYENGNKKANLII